MPKREDLKRIMIIGSGPMVIGQACEFDYSGNQGIKALKEEGYEVVLLNSNPATIMTDPNLVEATYIEPMTVEIVDKILAKEKVDAILPTLGGQTALNLAVQLFEEGILEKHGVELIGAKVEAIRKAEDRALFKQAMARIGIAVPQSGLAHNMEEAVRVAEQIGFPVILRPAFTLGGSGSGVAYNMEDFYHLVPKGLDASPVRQLLLEESVIGWKEFELEVMRDSHDNVVIVCSIENLDPMGVHTGDSITVAPAQTLTDKEYQIMRDASLAIIREIGVDTGGSNVQFAVNPANGKLYAIEMNPRVSRSSALASKATGFPIAKIATKLAVGYRLDEILNDITRYTPASFEPTLDYVVTKIPRFAFEKFPHADATLTTQMKSVGEVMAIGRTFKESLQKALRSLENDRSGFTPLLGKKRTPESKEKLQKALLVPGADRIWYLADAFRHGMKLEEVQQLTKIDPWFLHEIKQIVEAENGFAKTSKLTPETLRDAKAMGFSDQRLGEIYKLSEEKIRAQRKKWGISAVYKRVDTCAGEFEAYTPYLYSTYEEEDEAKVTKNKKVVILGSGPNRIGQGIEFDYCCVHAVMALKELGYETIMVNCNPETVSTDYDTSDRLYFEPLTEEDVLNILHHERPEGVIVQFGGQTPLKLTRCIEQAGFKILGTSPDSIDLAEDRKRFKQLLNKLKLKQPANGTATSLAKGLKIANRIGYPVMMRPSYVLGGRAMQIVYDDGMLRRYMKEAVKVSFDHPVLIDKFLDNAIEIDVDCVCDGKIVVVGGIMEHIEEAGVHSGDSACCLPPHSISSKVVDEIKQISKTLAEALNVVGLMNVQYALKGGDIYVLEVNPRASRTIPFVSKATGVALAKIAAKTMVGISLKKQNFTQGVLPPYLSVKEVALPFLKFPGVDTLLGPEMKSTGEVMGIDPDFGMAFAKAEISVGTLLPLRGKIFISVKDEDKLAILTSAKKLQEMNFELIATQGTSQFLNAHDVACERVNKVLEGSPHIVDKLKSHEIAMVINTPLGKTSAQDSFSIRRTALDYGVPYFTTIAAANAAVSGIMSLLRKGLQVNSLQVYHDRMQAPAKQAASS